MSSLPEPAAPASATDVAYEYIKAAVMSGRLAAGERIKEELIAEAVGVSRTPIRHAMQKLAAQGFVEVLHNHGARVAAWNDADLAEITELRALLEGFGASLAARKIDETTLEVLRELCAAMAHAAARATAADLETIAALNSRFHRTIIEAAGNRRLSETIGNLAHPLLVQRRFRAFGQQRLQRSMAHHLEIVDALAARDADWAGAVMRAHILGSAGADRARAAATHDAVTPPAPPAPSAPPSPPPPARARRRARP